MVDQKDFTGTPFVAGSIIGERCWQLVSGRLISPAMGRFLWTPGENVSICGRTLLGMDNPDEMLRRTNKHSEFRGVYVSRIDLTGPDDRVIGIIRRNHIRLPSVFFTDFKNVIVHYNEITLLDVKVLPIPEWRDGELYTVVPSLDQRKSVTVYQHSKTVYQKRIDRKKLFEILGIAEHEFKYCSCGFYAYTDRYNNEYISRTSVVGIIEGYGETMIGTKGFRSQKAKILALAPTNFSPPNEKYGRELLKGPARASLQMQYSDVAFFDDAETMRSEFPCG